MTLQKIKEVVELYANQIIQTECRNQNKVFLRAIYYKLCRELTSSGLAKIGASMDKNHATVLHGLKIFDGVMREPFYKKLYLRCYDYLTEADMLFSADDTVERVIENYEQRISVLEAENERLKRNYNRDIFKILGSMDSYTLRLFEETRLKPFLKLNDVKA